MFTFWWLALPLTQDGSILGPPLLVTENTGANNLPVLPKLATTLHQVLNHQFKP